MGTDYQLTENLSLSESSCRVVLLKDNDPWEPETLTDYLDEIELTKLIVKMVKVLSYISSNPNEILKRFNVQYEKDT